MFISVLSFPFSYRYVLSVLFSSPPWFLRVNASYDESFSTAGWSFIQGLNLQSFAGVIYLFSFFFFYTLFCDKTVSSGPVEVTPMR